MRPLIALLVLLLLVSTCPAQAADGRNLLVKQNSSAGKRVALVIGNGNYQYPDILPKLPNPPHDAEDIAAALRAFGFDVIEKKNQSKEDMDAAISEFGRKIANSEAALFYFAGHGLQVKGQNYLIPVDAKIESESQVPYKSINVNQLLDEMDNAKSSANIVMLDACRNNPISGKFRSGATRGLAPITSQPKGTVIVYATDPGNVAADGDGRNGLFTAGLLTAFKGSDLSLAGVLTRASEEVERGSDKKQTPYVNGPMTLQKEFHFGQGTQIASLKPVPAPTPAPARIKSHEEIEQEGWESARDSNSVEAVQEYLKQYPKGRFAGQAKILIATLKKPSAKPAEPAEPVTPPSGRADGENDLWGEAQKGNSKEDYQAYLDQYPKGKYVALAKSRIKKLQDDAQAAAEQQEQQAWQAAQDENSEAGYTRYLKGYPNGRYAGLAKARQEKLKNDLAAKEEAELWKKAESGNDKNAVEAYFNKYPSGRYVAAASEKLKAIKEEEAKGPAMVRIPGRNYEIGKYHVTRGEFAKFVSETGYDAGDKCWTFGGGKPEERIGRNWRNPGFTQDDNHPVTCVSWNDAQAYAAWLSKKTGKQYRLPVEAEWEYACYGGSQSEYCGGNDINTVAWYKDNSGGQTHPVGQKQANGYGLYDMSGNVWQWMENKYDDKNDWRAIRGGSWYDISYNPRADVHGRNAPALRDFYSGFRLARTLP